MRPPYDRSIGPQSREPLSITSTFTLSTSCTSALSIQRWVICGPHKTGITIRCISLILPILQHECREHALRVPLVTLIKLWHVLAYVAHALSTHKSHALVQQRSGR